ncbi:NADH dehydrogenase [ubiquinone] 1 beta subcomplex subunit 3-B-like [Camellia sinensis]|uniref:NADH dehydrogenase [ubiquinone] 1 beta subcomplex subunit 3-B-like n=1 Tax=Camellia sinensis TaxID=4442 RepID=UPI001035BB3E|nr:NADH dehydrogenase [ubiquinone] 1 beta subcomplex subunit 3-B-like [Camellia sinensis]
MDALVIVLVSGVSFCPAKNIVGCYNGCVRASTMDTLVRKEKNKRERERERERETGKPLGPTGEFFRRRDEWRKHPMLTNQLRHATPGLGIALVAFGIYLVGETAYNKISAPSHSHSHSHSSSSSSHTH